MFHQGQKRSTYANLRLIWTQVTWSRRIDRLSVDGTKRVVEFTEDNFDLANPDGVWYLFHIPYEAEHGGFLKFILTPYPDGITENWNMVNELRGNIHAKLEQFMLGGLLLSGRIPNLGFHIGIEMQHLWTPPQGYRKQSSLLKLTTSLKSTLFRREKQAVRIQHVNI